MSLGGVRVDRVRPTFGAEDAHDVTNRPPKTQDQGYGPRLRHRVIPVTRLRWLSMYITTDTSYALCPLILGECLFVRMSKQEVDTYIHRKKQNTHSVDNLIKIAHAMWDHRKHPNEEGVKRSALVDELGLDLDYSAKTCLNHLTEIDILEEYRKPGPKTYVIADWHDEVFIMGMVDEAADEGIEAVIDHVRDEDPISGDDTPAVADGAGITLRQVVAKQFDLQPAALEQHLRGGDQVGKLNSAVEAIEKHDDFEPRDDYGEIRFINVPYRYRLTEFAVDLYEQ